MQRLILLRHAEAEMTLSGGDFHRGLTEGGRRDARLTGQALAARGLTPEVVLVSSARRAAETWEAAASAFPGVRVEHVPALYNAGPEALLQAVEEAEAEHVMVVAHNPGLHQLALELAQGDRGADIHTFAPATAAVFRFKAGRPRLEALIRPGDGAGRVYKILEAEAWDEAVALGAFAGSEDDVRDGFIHLSAPDQVAETARRHFTGRAGLVLVAFDAERLGSALKWEPSRGGDLFPHLYAPLPAEAAIEARPLPLGADGAPAPGRLPR